LDRWRWEPSGGGESGSIERVASRPTRSTRLGGAPPAGRVAAFCALSKISVWRDGGLIPWRVAAERRAGSFFGW